MPTREEIDAHLDATLDRHPNVPRDVARRMLMVESSGNQSAVSPKGALGLMQLMPGTAREMGVDPTDWRQNIEGGVGYLSKQIDAFGGDVQKGVAAYHAGPGNVRKAERQGLRLPNTNDGITATPNYVRKVTGIGGGMPVEDGSVVEERRIVRPPEDGPRQSTLKGTYKVGDVIKEPLLSVPIQWAAPASAEKPKSAWESFADDTIGTLKLGVHGAAQSLREGVRQVLGDRVVRGIDELDAVLHGQPEGGNYLDSKAEEAQQSLSPEMTAAMQKEWVSGEEGRFFGPAFFDPLSYYGGFLQSLPEQIFTMYPAFKVARAAEGLAAARAAKTALKAGAAEKAAVEIGKQAGAKALERTALVAAGVLEGLSQAGHGAIEVRDAVNRLPDDVLDKSEAFRGLVERNGGDRAAARGQLANDQATTAYVLSGIATGIFGGFGDRTLLRLMGGKGSKSLIGRVLAGAMAEGGLEEAPQEYLSALAENYAKQGADPGQQLTEGALNRAVGGAVIGALQGGAMAGVAGRAPEEPTPTPKPPTERRAEAPAAPPAAGTTQPPPVAPTATTGTPATTSPEPTDDEVAARLAAAADSDRHPLMQDGDIGRKNDGQPFQNRRAATLALARTGRAETHEAVELEQDTWILRPKAPSTEEGATSASAQDEDQFPTRSPENPGVDRQIGGDAEGALRERGTSAANVGQAPQKGNDQEAFADATRAVDRQPPPGAKRADTVLDGADGAGPTVRTQGRDGRDAGPTADSQRTRPSQEQERLGQQTREPRDPDGRTAFGGAPQGAESGAEGGVRVVEKVASGGVGAQSQGVPDVRGDQESASGPGHMRGVRGESTAPEASEASVAETGKQEETGDVSRETPAESIQPKADANVIEAPVDQAAHEAATSPRNDLPQPTEGQKEAGNYAKGHASIGGMDISIENPEGSKRRPEWPTLKHHYGYLKGTVGRDKDHIDVFIKPGTPEDFSGNVYVVDQIDPRTKRFDEHKVMIGFATAIEAREAYLSNYQDGWRGLGAIRGATLENFKGWLANGNTKRPFAPQAGTKPAKTETRTPRTETSATGRETSEPAVVLAGNEFGVYSTLIDLRRKVLAWARKKIAGQRVVNDHTGETIIIPWQGVRHALSRYPSVEKLLVVPALPDLIRTSRRTVREPDRHGRRSVLGVERFVAKVRLGDRDLDAELVVRIHEDGRRYYDHDLSEIVEPAGTSGESRAARLPSKKSIQPATGSDESVGRGAAESNSRPTERSAKQKARDEESRRKAKGARTINPERDSIVTAAADAERESFALSGSDRPADVGAARGQGDLLSAPGPAIGQRSGLVPSVPDERFPNDTPGDIERLADLYERGVRVAAERMPQDQLGGAEETATAPLAPERQKRGGSRATQDDVGENLLANRRNLTDAGAHWEDVKDLSPALKRIRIVKVRIWPRPDYEALVADGMNPLIARIIKQVYDGIATAPAKSDDASLEGYIAAVHKVRDALMAWANDKEALAEFAQRTKDILQRRETNPFAYSDLGSTILDRIWPLPQPDARRFPSGSAALAEARLLGGNRALKAFQIDTDDLQKAIKEITQDGWPSKRESWQVQGYRILAPGEYTVDQPIKSERRNRETGETVDTGKMTYVIRANDRRWSVTVPEGNPVTPDKFAVVQDFASLNGPHQFDTRDQALENVRERANENRTLRGQDIRGANVRESVRTGPSRRPMQRVVDSVVADANAARDFFVTEAGVAKASRLLDAPSPAPLGDDATAGQRAAYVAAVNLEFLGYLNDAKSLSVEEFGKLDVPRKRLVLSAVLAGTHNPEVLRRIVQLVPVNVVDVLRARELSPDRLLNDKAVLGDLLAVNNDPSVSTPDADALHLIRSIAGVGAKGPLHDAALVAAEFYAAVHAGNDHARSSERDVSSLELMNTFGFRAINFGRQGWIKDAERQAYLNAAYDGLFDLAELLGVQPKALSLNGMLGIAFGAQGRGGHAAAHFVPGVNEINLTRTKGAGTLAHEWAHALDHHFARLAGLEGIGEPFLSVQGHRKDLAKTLRPEVAEAFATVYQAMHNRPQTAEEAVANRKALKERSLKALDRWLDVIRGNSALKGTSHEAKFNDLADRLRRGELGDGHVKSGNLSMPPVIAEIRELTKTARGRYELADNIKGLANEASFLRHLQATAEATVEHEPQKTRTDYAKESSAKDADKKGKRYWSTPWEMFARAFELYVADRLAKREQTNTFLSDAELRAAMTETVEVTDNALGRAAGHTTEVPRFPYPRGVDREAINGAIEKLIGVIEARETDRGIELHSLSPDQIPKLDSLESLETPSEETIDYSAVPLPAEVVVEPSVPTPVTATERRLDAARRVREITRLIADGDQDAAAEALAAFQRDYASARKIDDTARGAEGIKKRLMQAAQREEISEDSAQLAIWLLNQNPALADTLSLKIDKRHRPGSAGVYKAAERLITLAGGRNLQGDWRGDEVTAAHEILHHAERLMPQDVQQGIRDEWARRLADVGSWAANIDPELAARVMHDVLTMQMGDREAQQRVNERILDGTLPQEFYALTNPSEFWAVHGSRILSDRRMAERHGWIGKAKQWLRELVEKLKEVAGLSSDAPVIRALEQIISGDGEFKTERMIWDDPNGTGFRIARRGVYNSIEKPSASAHQVQKPGEVPIFGTNTTSLSQKVGDFMNNSRTFNRLLVGVQTQFHKAWKSPTFRPVFEATQNYLLTASQLAMDAAELAPSLLPNLTRVRDVLPRALGGKGYPSKTDLAAASKAVYSATLEDKKRYTDDELRDQFKLTDRQMALFHEHRAAIDKSLDDVAASVASKHARLLSGFPPSVVSAGKMDSAAAQQLYRDALSTMMKAAAESRQPIIDARARALRAITAQQKREVSAATDDAGRSAAKLRASQARTEVDRKAGEELAPIERKMQAIAAVQKEINKVFERSASLKSEGYAPLMRWGDYTVYAQGEEGESLFFGMYDTAAERNQVQRALQKLYPDAKVTAGVNPGAGSSLLRGVSPDTLELFADMLGADKDEAYQTYLKHAVNNRSALKRLIHRKEVLGYDPDLPRSLAAFVTSNGRWAARNYHFGEMTRAAFDIPKEQGDVKAEAEKLVAYVQNPQEEAAGLRSYLFVHFLGGSVASALVNMTQPALMTAPYLAQFGGVSKAAAALTAATAAMRKPTGALKAAMQMAEREGITAPHEIHQLHAEAIRGLGSNVHWRRFLTAWGSLFSLAEQFNRQLTFAAAFDLAEKGLSEINAKRVAGGQPAFKDAFDFAKRAVEETQGLYNRGNRPDWARGQVGATVFCVDDSTEALTQRGWLGPDDIKDGDLIASFDMATQRLRWAPVTGVFVKQYDGEMIHATSRSLDMLMTPDHRVVHYKISRVRGAKRGTTEWVLGIDEAQHIPASCRVQIPTSAEFDHAPTGEPVDDALAAVLGWIISEGYFDPVGNVFVYQNEGEKAQRIRADLAAAGLPWTESTWQWPAGNAIHVRFFIRKSAATGLRAMLPGKALTPALLMRMSKPQIAELVDRMLAGDGAINANGARSLIQNPGETLESFQMALTILGKSYSVRKHGPACRAVLMREPKRNKNGRYSVKRSERMPFSGRVWCPIVPITGTWVARRNGMPFITHNTFKQFSIAYVEFLARLPRKERAIALAILIVAAGLEGLPFAEDIEDMIDTIGQSLGYATNSKRALQNLAIKVLGEDLGRFAFRGGSAALPVDVSQRLGVGNMIPGTALLKRGEPDKTREIAQALGPAGGLAQQIGAGYQSVMAGQPMAAVKGVTPIALQNVFKAADMWQRGYYADQSGRRVIDTTPMDALFKAGGLQPADVAEAQRKVGNVQRDIKLAKTVEDEIADLWARGRADKEPETVERARQMLRDWNEKNPGLRIRISTEQIDRRVKQMRSERSERVIKSAPPELRGGVREALR